MGLISEIKKKSKHTEAPELDINQAAKAKLQRGEAIVINDKKSGDPYLIRVKSDKVGSDSLLQDDLEIEKIRYK